MATAKLHDDHNRSYNVHVTTTPGVYERSGIPGLNWLCKMLNVLTRGRLLYYAPAMELLRVEILGNFGGPRNEKIGAGWFYFFRLNWAIPEFIIPSREVAVEWQTGLCTFCKSYLAKRAECVIMCGRARKKLISNIESLKKSMKNISTYQQIDNNKSPNQENQQINKSTS